MAQSFYKKQIRILQIVKDKETISLADLHKAAREEDLRFGCYVDYDSILDSFIRIGDIVCSDYGILSVTESGTKRLENFRAHPKSL